MHIILGATGHVGSALAQALLGRNEPVTVLTRDASKTEALRRKGARV
ncbi:NAD(P)H-binding protein, partial [Salmonella enterica subsp. enterica serovar Hadar]